MSASDMTTTCVFYLNFLVKVHHRKGEDVEWAKEPIRELLSELQSNRTSASKAATKLSEMKGLLPPRMYELLCSSIHSYYQETLDRIKLSSEFEICTDECGISRLWTVENPHCRIDEV